MKTTVLFHFHISKININIHASSTKKLTNILIFIVTIIQVNEFPYLISIFEVYLFLGQQNNCIHTYKPYYCTLGIKVIHYHSLSKSES